MILVLQVAKARGTVEGRGAELVLEVEVGVLLEEDLDNVLPVPGAGVEEGGAALVGAGVDLGAALNQEPRDGLVTRGAGNNQWGPSVKRLFFPRKVNNFYANFPTLNRPEDRLKLRVRGATRPVPCDLQSKPNGERHGRNRLLWSKV